MALNPFEQLEFFVPEPKRAFAEIVETLLQDRFGACVSRTCGAEGRVYVGLSPGSPQNATLYQAKYFMGHWHSVQRRQVREALQRALQEKNPPQRWRLCVPARLASKDLRWFQRWRTQQAIEVEILDGNELVKMLKEPNGRRALEKIRSWGVTVAGAEPVWVHGRLRASAADPRSELTHYLYVSLYNHGGNAAKELRVELAHSETRCLSLRQDESQWCDEGQGKLNPRTLRARRPLLPKEDRLVTVIPICAQTPLPVTLRLRIWADEMAPVERHLCLDDVKLGQVHELDFGAGPGPELVLADVESTPAAAA